MIDVANATDEALLYRLRVINGQLRALEDERHAIRDEMAEREVAAKNVVKQLTPDEQKAVERLLRKR